MSVVTGTLLEHKHTRESWAVARLELTEPCDELGRKKGDVLTVVGGRLGLVQVGEALRLTGEIETHARFGDRLNVTEQASLGIKSTSQAHRWLERLDGVGPRLAERLERKFGEGILEVLGTPPAPGAPDPLLEVEGIGELTAQTIRESWAGLAASGSPEDLRYLDGMGLTHWETNNCLAFAKKRALAPRTLLETDPYSLVEVKGFGFLRTDTVALKAGASYQAPARLETASVYALGKLCDGDTLALLGRLVAEVAKLTGCEEALCLDAIVRCAERDQLVLTQDADRKRWAHPPELVAAERAIYRVLRDEERRTAEAEGAFHAAGWTPRVLEGGAASASAAGPRPGVVLHTSTEDGPAEELAHDGARDDALLDDPESVVPEEVRQAANGGPAWRDAWPRVVEPWEGP